MPPKGTQKEVGQDLPQALRDQTERLGWHEGAARDGVELGRREQLYASLGFN